MGTRTCPRCRVISEAAATTCDCGYNFSAGRIRTAQAPRQAPSRQGRPGPVADVLALAQDYQSLVKLALLQAVVGFSTRIAAFAARRIESNGLLLAVNVVGMILLITLSVMTARRAFRIVSAMGLASPRGWAVALGLFGIFGMLAMNLQGRKWSERQGISLAFSVPT